MSEKDSFCKENKTGVINDPLGQTYSSEHCFRLKFLKSSEHVQKQWSLMDVGRPSGSKTELNYTLLKPGLVALVICLLR